MKVLTLFVLFTTLTTLVACGQKGALYLPDTTTPTASPAQPDEPNDNTHSDY